MKLKIAAAVLILSLVPMLSAQDHSKIQSSPQWEKMKTLVGHWEGTMEEAGQKFPARTNYRMTGDGSALMNTLGEGSPYEMVSMIHPDGPKLMMTHYCAGHNQPRMRVVNSSDPNKIVFDFVDITNASPSDSHMHRVTFTFDGPDHHTEDWVSKQGDKETLGHFDFRRVAAK